MYNQSGQVHLLLVLVLEERDVYGANIVGNSVSSNWLSIYKEQSECKPCLEFASAWY